MTSNSAALFDPIDTSFTLTPCTNPGAPLTPIITGGTNDNSNNFTINFSSPTNNGGFPITGYQYFCSILPVAAGQESWVDSPSNVYAIAVPDLSNGQMYRAKVRAVATNTNTQPSTPIYGQLTEYLQTPARIQPSAPTINGIDVSNTSIVVRYTAPANTGGFDISGYMYSLNNAPTWSILPTSSISITGTTGLLTIPTTLAAGSSNSVKIAATNKYYSSTTDINARGKESTPSTFTQTNILNILPVPPRITAFTAGSAHNFTISFSDTSNVATDTSYQYGFSTTLTIRPPRFYTPVASPLTSSVKTGSIGVSGEVISDLSNGIPYYVSLQAINTSGLSTPISVYNIPQTLIQPPYPPTITDISNNGDRSAVVFFNNPIYVGSLISSYKYFIDGLPLLGTQVTLPSTFKPATDTSCCIAVPNNGISYNITIMATNGAGSSSVSNSKPITTACAPGGPVISSVLPAAGNIGILTYTDASSNGAEITRYQYACTPTSTNVVNWIDVSFSPITPITITGISYNTNYNVQMKAYNKMGWGTTTTAAPTPSFSMDPEKATINSVVRGNNCVTITFTPGNPYGYAVTYLYGYNLTGNSPPNWTNWIELIPATKATLPQQTIITPSVPSSPLSNGSSYYIKIRSRYTKSGTSSTTAIDTLQYVNAVTPATSPGDVSSNSFLATCDASNTATIQFLPPTNGGLDISYQYCYKVNASDATPTSWISCGPATITTPLTTPSTNTISLSGLSNGVTYYSLQLRAVNIVGPGLPNNTPPNVTVYDFPSTINIVDASRNYTTNAITGVNTYLANGSIIVDKPTSSGFSIVGYMITTLNNKWSTAGPTYYFSGTNITDVSGNPARSRVAISGLSTAVTFTIKAYAYFCIPVSNTIYPFTTKPPNLIPSQTPSNSVII